jgi:D-alanyl-D-alanine dipeptidase
MYLLDAGVRRRRPGSAGRPWSGIGRLGADVSAAHPRSGAPCTASERRIRPVIEARPEELVTIESKYLTDPASSKQLHRAAYAAFQNLKAAAEADGIPREILKIISGYRSVAHQQRLWDEALKKYGSEKEARRWVAPSGGSPHHTGRAIDFWLGTKNSSSNIPALRATAAYKWLVCNAVRFGFFPYANEPWHWEYNPEGFASAAAAPPPAPTAAPSRSSTQGIQQVQAAIAQGSRDPGKLTDLIFYARHPERQGRRLAAGEQALVREWLQIRENIVRPILSHSASAAPAPAPAPAASVAASSPPGLSALAAFIAPETAPSVQNALNIMKIICGFRQMPWRLGYTILEHEGGVRLFRKHGDGVMQTTRSAREATIPRIPRELKLALIGPSLSSAASDSDLNRALQQEFGRRLAVQIATGVEELKTNLDRFNSYVALSFIAYNTGPGWAYYMATRGKQKSLPGNLTPEAWENMCRFGASLLHILPDQVRVSPGVWQCDVNIPAWFAHFGVFDPQSGMQLIGYKYLRSFRGQIRKTPPAKSECTAATHGSKFRREGSGPLAAITTRAGALDKLYNPSLLGADYYAAARNELPAISADNQPLKAFGEQLVKVPPLLT